ESDAASVGRTEETGESALGSFQIALISGFFVGSHQHRDSLPLRQGRIPWGSERIAVLPVEIVVPDGEARAVLFEVCAEPVGSEEKFLSPFKIAALTEKVVVAQAVLRDGDRVVLHADTSVIVKQRNAVWIVSTRIVGLLGEQHVVF